MANGYTEIVEVMKKAGKSFKDIKYCWFSEFDVADYNGRELPKYFIMLKNSEDGLKFLKKRLKKYNYYERYGYQQLFGEVVFNDGTWLERGEYDGAEWREYKKTPEAPTRDKFKEAEDKYVYEHTHSVLEKD